MLVMSELAPAKDKVPVRTGRVSVVDPETAGAAKVIEPLVSPETTIEAIRTP
jgi:hypothetical protein